MLKDLDIKAVLMKIKNPQDNAPVERLHQVILNMIIINDIDNKVFNHIDPWGETLTSIEWAIKYSYHCTIMATPGQDIFVRNMIFNLPSVVD